MPRVSPLAFAGVLAFAAFAVSCGGRETTASKSAAAFDEAQRKGEAPGGGQAHGGHGTADTMSPGPAGEHDETAAAAGAHQPGSASAPGGSRSGMDHSGMRGMSGMEQTQMPAGEAHGAGAHGPAAQSATRGRMPADHSRTSGTDRSRPSAVDHANMPGMSANQHAGHGAAAAPRPGAPRTGAPMAGMDHANMPSTAGAHGAHGAPPASTPPTPSAGPPSATAAAAMDHSNMPGMDHSAMTQASPGVAPAVPERPAATASRDGLVATLQPDGLDAPAPTAIRDAARSAEMAQQMTSGGHGMAHGTYRQVDAGRDEVPASSGGHEGHQMDPQAPPPSSSGAHGAHSPTPSSRPAARPSGGQQPQPQAAPAAADPHAMHGQPAKPQPKPTPTPTPRPQEKN